jgi:RND superfamily putative drug exporter
VIVLGGVLGAAGGAHFTDSTRLPASDSSTAYSLLAKAGNDSASAKVGTIVWHVDHGSAVSGAARSRMTAVLRRESRVDGVQSVVSPFTATGSSQISKDDRTAYATVIFASTAHTDEARDIAAAASTSSLRVLTGGTEFTNQTPSEASEGIGILAALLVLLLVFGHYGRRYCRSSPG